MNKKFTQEELDRITKCNTQLSDAFAKYKEEKQDTNILNFFVHQLEFLLANKESFFGKRIHTEDYSTSYKKVEDNYNVLVKCSVCDENNDILIYDLQIEFALPNTINTKCIKPLMKQYIELGLNGYLINPQEFVDFFKLNAKCIGSPEPALKTNWDCDTCNKHYKTAKGLANHLRTTKHDDKLLHQFGYWDNLG